MDGKATFSVKDMDGKAMFSVKELPWHRLGTVLDLPPTTDEALFHSGLNWPVMKAPNMINMGNGSDDYFSTGKYSTYRLDSDNMPVILGDNISDRYEIVQNIDAFKPFDKVLLDHGYTYETAGAVCDGKRIWVMAKSPDSILVGNDVIQRYVLLFNSHDGSLPVILLPTDVRVVCNNTLTMALNAAGRQMQLKHTMGVNERLDKVVDILNAADGQFHEAYDVYNRMNEIEMDVKTATNYFEELMPKLTNRGNVSYTPTGRKRPDRQISVYDTLIDNFVSGPGNTGETLWHAYNAVTQYVDHGKAYKDWVESTTFGGWAALKHDAFSLASQITRATSSPTIVN